jgi:hypothetical protein
VLGFLFAGYLALVGRLLESVNARLQPISPPPGPALDRAQAARSVFGILTLASVLTGFHGPSASAGPSRGVWLYLPSLLQAPFYKTRLEMLRS